MSHDGGTASSAAATFLERTSTGSASRTGRSAASGSAGTRPAAPGAKTPACASPSTTKSQTSRGTATPNQVRSRSRRSSPARRRPAHRPQSSRARMTVRTQPVPTSAKTSRRVFMGGLLRAKTSNTILITVIIVNTDFATIQADAHSQPQILSGRPRARRHRRQLDPPHPARPVPRRPSEIPGLPGIARRGEPQHAFNSAEEAGEEGDRRAALLRTASTPSGVRVDGQGARARPADEGAARVGQQTEGLMQRGSIRSQLVPADDLAPARVVAPHDRVEALARGSRRLYTELAEAVPDGGKLQGPANIGGELVEHRLRRFPGGENPVPPGNAQTR